MEPILQAENLAKAFGSVQAVASVTLEVQRGEILGVLGPNGSGKTTLFNLLTGVHLPDSGSILFDGHDITKQAPYQRSRNGIGRTYQIPRPFNKMTVYENLLVGAVHGGGLSEKKARPKVLDILDMINLLPQKDTLAGGLPLLNRKALELGRALATQPKLILLDEIAGGLTEKEAHQVLGIVKKVWEQGVTIVWIEHVLAMMSEGADRLLVITQGQFLKCGEPQDVMNSDEVLECYLGAED
jgi:branched-chain amino acid transport system ATP-binding protein